MHLLGIRHHGPGSARQLLAALDALQPRQVLIEGPADASALLPLLGEPDMEPPVALLAYPTDAAERAVFWPFARFSPEYQAVRWALRRGADLAFIDLPAAQQLARAAADGTDSGAALRGDPIGALARAAGYEDGESWWRDVIEENPAPGSIFAAIADAMSALRGTAAPAAASEAAREAHMRLAIARAAGSGAGPIAVVCGAWHVPALGAASARADDRALLRGAPRCRIAATWVPWTSPRLALASGYGAGVVAPGWCAHLWDSQPERIEAGWLVRAGAALRSRGHLVSTAGVIDAQQLGRGLAALRGRPAPGFEELRDAVVACLCSGEERVWESIAAELLIGAEVGRIPVNVPLAPLLEDLARQQKLARLRPEALQRELSLDLRSESGLLRSTLLHRLCALGVPWGQQVDAGRSRGTFRERWVLCWEPEFAVRLVENLVYGSSIEQAASGVLGRELACAPDLGTLAQLVRAALTAQLPAAAAAGIERLDRRIAHTSDCQELLQSLPPLADVLRYGQARALDAQQLGALARRLAVQCALSLPHAARGLDAAAAGALRDALEAADGALRLAQFGPHELELWSAALEQLVADGRSAQRVAGCAARLLCSSERLAPADALALLGRRLSPGSPVSEAAAFLEGFFEGAGQRLIYDGGLREAVDAWLWSLPEETFAAHLPLLRRVFASLDRSERRRLCDALLGADAPVLVGLELAPDAGARWAAHLEHIGAILTREPAELPPQSTQALPESTQAVGESTQAVGEPGSE